MSVSDSMIVHIQDAKSSKQVWDTLVKMYNTNTQAHKMQLKQKLHNLHKKQDEHQRLFYKSEKPCRCYYIYKNPCK
jgi:hypothetical protein